MRSDRGVMALVVSMVLVVTPVMAQEAHVVDQNVIDQALSEHSAEDDAHREAVLRLLQRQEVRALAAKVQVDFKRAEAAVQTLEGDDLLALASMAREVEAGLSGGGSTITVSTTMIIIGLLILILIIVAT